MKSLSVIISVYNVEAYLRKCIDSVLAQDLEDYEVILVDDGSTDGSAAICDEYASMASQMKGGADIRVIHQKNKGLSEARNSGIEATHGKYVCFVDGDDYLESKVLGTIMDQVGREQLDVLRFDYQNVRLSKEGQYECFQPNKYRHIIDMGTDVVSGETYLEKRMGYACYACQFVIKHDMVSRFMPDIHFEDTEWLPRMLLKARRVNSTPLIAYNYFRREGSITQGHDTDKIRRNIEDCITVVGGYNTYISQYPHSHWLHNMQGLMVVNILAQVAQFFYPEREEYIVRMTSLGVFPLSLANQGKTYMRKALLANISPRLLVELLHLKNKK